MIIINPKIFAKFPNLIATQSTRQGGFSLPPYDSMNLGSNTNDDPNTLRKNKEKFCNDLGFEYIQVAKSKQVHGTEILKVEKPGSYEGYDALITDKTNIFITVSTADCASILIYDSKNKACAAIHAGWKGSKDLLTYQTALRMKKEFNSDPVHMYCFMGACIGECSFEVDADVAQYFDDPHCRYDSKKEKYFINLKGHNKSQLLHFGVPEDNIEVSPYDTYVEEELFFSHRRDKGVTGRMWSLIGLNER